jgi:hypothetical protein
VSDFKETWEIDVALSPIGSLSSSVHYGGFLVSFFVESLFCLVVFFFFFFLKAFCLGFHLTCNY